MIITWIDKLKEDNNKLNNKINKELKNIKQILDNMKRRINHE